MYEGCILHLHLLESTVCLETLVPEELSLSPLLCLSPTGRARRVLNIVRSSRNCNDSAISLVLGFAMVLLIAVDGHY